MARNKLAIYVWIVDTIERHGRITLQRLNRLWVDSPLSDGTPLPRRTFFNYRNAIEEMFSISLECDRSTFEYYIADNNNEAARRMQQWLLNSMSLSGVLRDSSDLSGRIILENVPSARDHLPVVLDAMRQGHRIMFDYKSYQRVNYTTGNVIEPYFVKIFKQVWYVIGMNVRDHRIKTYALDRMRELHITDQHFTMPANFDPVAFFNDCFGITTNQDTAKDIALRVSSTQAKYLRAVPLHHSQQEEVHDRYSIMHYRMKLTYDLKEALLSMGSNVEVLSPPELKAQVVSDLKQTLALYE